MQVGRRYGTGLTREIKEPMPYYESVIIARQDMSGTQVEALADQLAAVVEERGGSIAKREHWGLKNLAFRMKKNRKGHYVMFDLDAPSDAIQEMERQMRLSEDVLRYMTIRIEKIEEEPSAMMQARSSRDDRRRGERGDRPERGDRDRGDRPERGDRDRGDRPERSDRAETTTTSEGASE